MPINLEVLKTELLAGHPVTGAYNVDDALAAGEINAENVTRFVPLSVAKLREWAATNARAHNLNAAQTTGATDQIKNIAVILMGIFNSDDGILDPGNSIHVAAVNELVAASVWTSGDRDDLVTKATEAASQATVLGLGRVREGEVQQARAL